MPTSHWRQNCGWRRSWSRRFYTFPMLQKALWQPCCCPQCQIALPERRNKLLASSSCLERETSIWHMGQHALRPDTSLLLPSFNAAGIPQSFPWDMPPSRTLVRNWPFLSVLMTFSTAVNCSYCPAQFCGSWSKCINWNVCMFLARIWQDPGKERPDN